MQLIPFDHTWPYERQMGDVYIATCPYCQENNVLTHMSNAALERAKDRIKTRLNMPCCKKTMTIIEADDDYFWTNERLRD
ncbi:hypothetical protein FLK61_36680 [Paenalkalicoccus suaedae]|uniref:Uncharacterized protein n=1 Tax=Paenalkalicoccus suaedae TaxID=2592382 RepID=A0A859FHR3_9BACI|nr:hypothetical protein [Paenalkalicoccus suaedae]QKS72182.1 hypothetical protein FLK61_36680 [Paenalkalicoccus suaedae]